MVFSWHFTHGWFGTPSPFAGAPGFFPLALIDEGHTGVALFMTLSGYLFAKLLSGKTIRFLPFFWNRLLRLGPLLVLVMILVGAQALSEGQTISGYMSLLSRGFVFPDWPNGGWSITAELHFYVLLPVLLVAMHRWRFAPLLLVALAISLRYSIYLHDGEVQRAAYWTIVGRIDQFLFGMFAFECRRVACGRHGIAAVVLLAFMGFYWAFDRAGGFYLLDGGYPSPSALWIVLPTIEGAVYAFLIAWYDASFTQRHTWPSRVAATAGAYSYSIYLLHPFVVFKMAAWIDAHVMSLSSYYVAFAWSILGYLAMMPIGWLSYRLIESPFLRLRRRYALETGNDRAFETKKAAPVGPPFPEVEAPQG